MTAKKQPARKTPAKKAAPAAKKAPARKVAAKSVPPAKKTNTKAQKPAAASSPSKEQVAEQVAAQSVKDLVGEANRAVGRPTKYSDEFIPMMLAYFNIETERTEDVPVRDKEGNVVLGKDKQPLIDKVTVVNKFPTLERFANKIGVTRETLHDWATAKDELGSLIRPEFSYTYTRAKNLQSALLQEGGLAGNYEARVVNFALKNLAGWKEQIEQTITADVNVTTNEALDEIYNEGIEAARQAEAETKARELSGIVPGERK